MTETAPETPVQLYCGNCGAPIPPKKHFCEVCLAPASLATTTPPAPAPAPPEPVQAAGLAAHVTAAQAALPGTPATGALPTLPQGPTAVPPGAPIAPSPGGATPTVPSGPTMPQPAPAVVPVPPGAPPPAAPSAPAARPAIVPVVLTPARPAAAAAPSGSNTWWIVLMVVSIVLAAIPLLLGCLGLLFAEDLASTGSNTASENYLYSLFCCIVPGLLLGGVAFFAGRRAFRQPR